MIRRVEVKGLASYGENESVVEFGRGKNVIVGENATGKSALLLAIELGFLGSVGGRNLGDIINDDADEGEVNIDFVHPSSGAELRIHRRIRRTRGKESEQASQIEARLENLATGEVIADRPMEIDRALQELGIDRNVFSTIVHIRQGEIDEILKSSNEQRETLDRLLGIADLEQAYRDIGENRSGRYSGLLRELNHMKESLIEQKQVKEQAAADLHGAHNRLQQLQTRILSLREDERKLLHNLSDSKTAWQRVQKVIESLEEAENRLHLASARCQEREEALIASLAQAESYVGQAPHGMGDMSSSLKPNKSPRVAEIENALTQQLVETEEREKELPNLTEERDELEESHSSTRTTAAIHKNEIQESQARIQRIVEFLDKQKGVPEIVCELCGSRLDEEHYEEHLLKTRLELETKERLLESEEEELERIRKQRLEVDQRIDETESMISRKEALEALLVSIKGHDDTLRRYSTDRINLQTTLDTVKKDCESLFGQAMSLQDLKARADTLRTDISAIPVRIESIATEIETSEGQIGTLELQIQTMQESMKEAEILGNRAQEYENKMHILATEIRPSLRDVQPTIRRIFLDRVNRRAMEYFSRLYASESKYKRTDIDRIWVDDGYHFWAERLGHVKPCSRLSGGQSIVVSLSFLFAFLDELGGSLGFLLLDEPSNHLDQKRIEELIAVLQELQNVPQLIVVDHREELARSADVRYRVVLEDGFSHIEQIT